MKFVIILVAVFLSACGAKIATEDLNEAMVSLLNNMSSFNENFEQKKSIELASNFNLIESNYSLVIEMSEKLYERGQLDRSCQFDIQFGPLQKTYKVIEELANPNIERDALQDIKKLRSISFYEYEGKSCKWGRQVHEIGLEAKENLRTYLGKKYALEWDEANNKIDAINRANFIYESDASNVWHSFNIDEKNAFERDSQVRACISATVRDGKVGTNLRDIQSICRSGLN